jgi:LPXTG-motif cell wall-anchored protein
MLPSTGGAGTGLIYLAGILLTGLAGAFLVSGKLGRYRRDPG